MNPFNVNIHSEKVTMEIQHTDRTLPELWKEYLSGKDVVVFLSGGIDSQFSCSVANDFARSVKAYTFAIVWRDNIINASDVIMAQRFCERTGTSLTIKEFDLEKFYAEELLTFSKRYGIISPQISAHLRAAERVMEKDLSSLYLTGGEFSTHAIYMSGTKQSITISPRIFGEFLKKHYAPHYHLANDIGVEFCRDLFLISPESLYLAYQHNVEVIKTNNIILELDVTSVRKGQRKYKEAYYKSFGYELIPQLEKQTGFESLRQYLAIETGNYDEFDNQYRKPLVNNSFDPKITKFIGYPLTAIHEQVNKLIAENSPEICNTFTLDW